MSRAHLEERGLVTFQQVSVLNHAPSFGRRPEWGHFSSSPKQKQAQNWAIKSWGGVGGAPGEVGDGLRASG